MNQKLSLIIKDLKLNEFKFQNLKIQNLKVNSKFKINNSYYYFG